MIGSPFSHPEHLTIGHYRWEKNGDYLVDLYVKVFAWSPTEIKYTIPKGLLFDFIQEETKLFQKIVKDIIGGSYEQKTKE